MRPVVGIITNNHALESEYPITGVGQYEINALRAISNVVPILLPACNSAIEPEEALALCDGFYLPGGRENVHPNFYGEELTDKHGDMNPCRDELSLRLIKLAVEQSKPILGVCRGHQELAVAFGSTLYAEVRDEPGRMNHRMPPEGTVEEKFALRHDIELKEGGKLHNILGETRLLVNTLHGQAVKELGANVELEAWAEDQTVEAISIKDASNFALGVQWHPEYRASEREASRKLFEAFGASFA